MIDSIKALWTGHHLANQAQLPAGSNTLVGPWIDREKSHWWDQDLPKKQEFWKYVKFSKIADRALQVAAPANKVNRIHKDDSGKWLIEVNDLSQGATWMVEGEGLVYSLPELLNQPELLGSWQDFLNQPWASNYFAAINRSFLFTGFAFRVPANTSLDIELNINCEHQEDSFLPFQVWYDLGKNSSVNVKENIFATTGAPWVIYDRLVNIAAGGRLRYFQCEEGSNSSRWLQNLSAFCYRDASFEHFDMTLPSQWSRHNLDVKMLEPGAHTGLFGLYLNDQDYYTDHHTKIDHLSPNTTSKQHYKGVLGGKSQSVFNGQVHIGKGAEHSNSEQLNKNLLLSDKAEIDTKPELQIDNDNVKAAHGATVGQLNPEEMFYLMSRGLSRQQSWDLLCKAFIVDLFTENFADVDLKVYQDRLTEGLTRIREGADV